MQKIETKELQTKSLRIGRQRVIQKKNPLVAEVVMQKLGKNITEKGTTHGEHSK